MHASTVGVVPFITPRGAERHGFKAPTPIAAWSAFRGEFAGHIFRRNPRRIKGEASTDRVEPEGLHGSGRLAGVGSTLSGAIAEKQGIQRRTLAARLGGLVI